jgi:hypothetical protein
VWSDGKGRCTDAKEAEAAQQRVQGGSSQTEGAFACTRSSDCGAGSQCCTSMTVGPHATNCSNQCDLANSMRVCDSDRDCRPIAKALCAGDPGCWQQVRCSALPSSSGYPSWLKTCRSAD